LETKGDSPAPNLCPLAVSSPGPTLDPGWRSVLTGPRLEGKGGGRGLDEDRIGPFPAEHESEPGLVNPGAEMKASVGGLALLKALPVLVGWAVRPPPLSRELHGFRAGCMA
jgi:hypothetical protein